MALTESKLRQIIKEEARKMMESERTPRGLPTSRGEPRDMDPNRDVAYGRGHSGVRFGRAVGGRDEQWDDEDDGSGWNFNYKQPWKKGDMVRWGSGVGTVIKASEVTAHVQIELEDGQIVDADGGFLKRA